MKLHEKLPVLELTYHPRDIWAFMTWSYT